MQKNDQAEKKKVLYDGEEVAGLVTCGEIALEKGTLEVPEFSRIRSIQNGVSKIPAIELTYKVAKDSQTLKFFREWYLNDQVKDTTIIRCDASGSEFARTLLPDCECVRYVEPAFDGANVTYAQVSVTILPWDVTPIDGE